MPNYNISLSDETREMSPDDIARCLTRAVEIYTDIKMIVDEECSENTKRMRLEFLNHNKASKRGELSQKLRKDLKEAEPKARRKYYNNILESYKAHHADIESKLLLYLDMQFNLLKQQEKASQEEAFYPSCMNDYSTIQENKTIKQTNMKHDWIRKETDLLSAYKLGMDYCFNRDEMAQEEHEIRKKVVDALIDKTNLLLKLSDSEVEGILKKEKDVIAKSLMPGVVTSLSNEIEDHAESWFNDCMKAYETCRKSQSAHSKDDALERLQTRLTKYGMYVRKPKPLSISEKRMTTDELALRRYAESSDDDRKKNATYNDYMKKFSAAKVIKLPLYKVKNLFETEKAKISQYLRDHPQITKIEAEKEATEWCDECIKLVKEVKSLPPVQPTTFTQKHGLTSVNIDYPERVNGLRLQLSKYGYRVDVLSNSRFTLETGTQRILNKYRIDRISDWLYFFYYRELAKINNIKIRNYTALRSFTFIKSGNFP